jgi:hypothetical protein
MLRSLKPLGAPQLCNAVLEVLRDLLSRLILDKPRISLVISCAQVTDLVRVLRRRNCGDAQ